MLKAFRALKRHALGTTLLLSSLLSKAINKSKHSEAIFSQASARSHRQTAVKQKSFLKQDCHITASSLQHAN